jgi:tRNA threonylcarbamoyladenosine biosynthesis protein TsaE
VVAVSLHTIEETERLAQCVAAALRSGDVIELIGPIGAGKTTFVGALLRTLGSTEPARSPTYTIAHEYDLAAEARFAHLDLYRHAGELDEAAWGDIEPVFECDYVAVEWPAPARGWYVGRSIWQIELTPVAGTSRLATVRAPDPQFARILTRELVGATASAGA